MVEKDKLEFFMELIKEKSQFLTPVMGGFVMNPTNFKKIVPPQFHPFFDAIVKNGKIELEFSIILKYIRSNWKEIITFLFPASYKLWIDMFNVQKGKILLETFVKPYTGLYDKYFNTYETYFESFIKYAEEDTILSGFVRLFEVKFKLISIEFNPARIITDLKHSQFDLIHFIGYKINKIYDILKDVDPSSFKNMLISILTYINSKTNLFGEDKKDDSNVIVIEYFAKRIEHLFSELWNMWNSTNNEDEYTDYESLLFDYDENQCLMDIVEIVNYKLINDKCLIDDKEFDGLIRNLYDSKGLMKGSVHMSSQVISSIAGKAAAVTASPFGPIASLVAGTSASIFASMTVSEGLGRVGQGIIPKHEEKIPFMNKLQETAIRSFQSHHLSTQKTAGKIAKEGGLTFTFSMMSHLDKTQKTNGYVIPSASFFYSLYNRDYKTLGKSVGSKIVQETITKYGKDSNMLLSGVATNIMPFMGFMLEHESTIKIFTEYAQNIHKKTRYTPDRVESGYFDETNINTEIEESYKEEFIRFFLYGLVFNHIEGKRINFQLSRKSNDDYEDEELKLDIYKLSNSLRSIEKYSNLQNTKTRASFLFCLLMGCLDKNVASLKSRCQSNIKDFDEHFEFIDPSSNEDWHVSEEFKHGYVKHPDKDTNDKKKYIDTKFYGIQPRKKYKALQVFPTDKTGNNYCLVYKNDKSTNDTNRKPVSNVREFGQEDRDKWRKQYEVLSNERYSNSRCVSLSGIINNYINYYSGKKRALGVINSIYKFFGLETDFNDKHKNLFYIFIHETFKELFLLGVYRFVTEENFVSSKIESIFTNDTLKKWMKDTFQGKKVDIVISFTDVFKKILSFWEQTELIKKERVRLLSFCSGDMTSYIVDSMNPMPFIRTILGIIGYKNFKEHGETIHKTEKTLKGVKTLFNEKIKEIEDEQEKNGISTTKVESLEREKQIYMGDLANIETLDTLNIKSKDLIDRILRLSEQLEKETEKNKKSLTEEEKLKLKDEIDTLIYLKKEFVQYTSSYLELANKMNDNRKMNIAFNSFIEKHTREINELYPDIIKSLTEENKLDIIPQQRAIEMNTNDIRKNLKHIGFSLTTNELELLQKNADTLIKSQNSQENIEGVVTRNIVHTMALDFQQSGHVVPIECYRFGNDVDNGQLPYGIYVQELGNRGLLIKKDDNIEYNGPDKDTYNPIISQVNTQTITARNNNLSFNPFLHYVDIPIPYSGNGPKVSEIIATKDTTIKLENTKGENTKGETGSFDSSIFNNPYNVVISIKGKPEYFYKQGEFTATKIKTGEIININFEELLNMKPKFDLIKDVQSSNPFLKTQLNPQLFQPMPPLLQGGTLSTFPTWYKRKNPLEYNKNAPKNIKKYNYKSRIEYGEEILNVICDEFYFTDQTKDKQLTNGYMVYQLIDIVLEFIIKKIGPGKIDLPLEIQENKQMVDKITKNVVLDLFPIVIGAGNLKESYRELYNPQNVEYMPEMLASYAYKEIENIDDKFIDMLEKYRATLQTYIYLAGRVSDFKQMQTIMENYNLYLEFISKEERGKEEERIRIGKEKRDESERMECESRNMSRIKESIHSIYPEYEKLNIVCCFSTSSDWLNSALYAFLANKDILNLSKTFKKTQGNPLYNYLKNESKEFWSTSFHEQAIVHMSEETNLLENGIYGNAFNTATFFRDLFFDDKKHVIIKETHLTKTTLHEKIKYQGKKYYAESIITTDKAIDNKEDSPILKHFRYITFVRVYEHWVKFNGHEKGVQEKIYTQEEMLDEIVSEEKTFCSIVYKVSTGSILNQLSKLKNKQKSIPREISEATTNPLIRERTVNGGFKKLLNKTRKRIKSSKKSLD